MSGSSSTSASEVGPGRRGILLPPDDQPVAAEPLAPLELVDRRVVIGPAGQQRGGAVRLPDGGDLVGGEGDRVMTIGSPSRSGIRRLAPSLSGALAAGVLAARGGARWGDGDRLGRGRDLGQALVWSDEAGLDDRRGAPRRWPGRSRAGGTRRAADRPRRRRAGRCPWRPSRSHASRLSRSTIELGR